MNKRIKLVITPDPEWTRGDQLQLLRLLFGPRPDGLVDEDTVEDATVAVCLPDPAFQSEKTVSPPA